jgi:hypothetical protein
MFEVVIKNGDGTTETWDGLTAMQAKCVFFRAQTIANTIRVTINEFIDFSFFSL